VKKCEARGAAARNLAGARPVVFVSSFRGNMERAAMTHAVRPLHRLTPLIADPAATWLTAPQRLRVAMTGWFGWIGFWVFLKMLFWAQVAVLLQVMGWVPLRFPAIITGMIALALIWPARRIILRRRAAKAAELVRDGAPAMAIAIDDLTQLEDQVDATVVSLVGWIRARGQLGQPVGGEPCIGLSLACHQRYPGVLETLNDFELIDEAGNTVLVQVAGGRMLGASNVSLTNARERMLLVASLDLPVGAVATGWDAFVLRDGDPVMVVGFKQTALDPSQSSLRAPPERPTVGSLPPRPLLIFPIAAERRAQASSLFNLS